MNKTTDHSTDQRLTVNITDLMKILGLGRASAAQIGQEAGAVLHVGRRCLYYLPKIQSYMERLTQE